MHLPINPKLFCWAASIRLSGKIVIIKLNNPDVPGRTAGTHDRRRNNATLQKGANTEYLKANNLHAIQKTTTTPLLAFQNPPL